MATSKQRVLAWSEWVIRQACRRLPIAERGKRVREWTNELPEILADPDVRFSWMRAVRTLMFAVGTFEAAYRLSRGSGASRAWLAGRVRAFYTTLETVCTVVGMALFFLGMLDYFVGGITITLMGGPEHMSSTKPLLLYTFASLASLPGVVVAIFGVSCAVKGAYSHWRQRSAIR